LAEALCRKNNQVVRVVYGTSRISGAFPTDTPERGRKRDQSRARQTLYLDALEAHGGIEIVTGHFMTNPLRCHACKNIWTKPEEKMTDVQLASQVLADGFQHRIDHAIIVSGDSDLVPPVRVIKKEQLPVHVTVAFPPGRRSTDLAHASDDEIQIWQRTLERCQLPDVVRTRDGIKLERPAHWKVLKK